MSTELLFTRPAFYIFLLTVMVGLSLLKNKSAMRNAFLFAASLFFYWKTSAAFVFLLLFSTVADWGIAAVMDRSEHLQRRLWLTLSVLINLGLLGFFKYAYFFADSSAMLFDTSFRVESILLPVGISFYTFQTLSYSIDVYRRKVAPVKSLLDFGCYVTFFPQLVAGPIVRAKDFIPQLQSKYDLSRKEFNLGVWWILTGLIKKIVIADYIAMNLVDRVFANPTSYSGMEVLLGLYGYSLQVYADFSGYSDIAIGVALLMGFRLAKNFRSPYKARNVGEFWGRWHISLSTWLRDYLYIPMGGSRRASMFSVIFSIGIVLFAGLMFREGEEVINLGVIFLGGGMLMMICASGVMFTKWGVKLATYINILATMIIGGLWHGASWNFLLWGALNGVGLLVYKIVGRHLPWAKSEKFLARAWGVILTFNFITFTRIWFRSGSSIGWDTAAGDHNILTEWITANDLLYQITNHFYDIPPLDLLKGHLIVISLMAGGYMLHLMPTKITSKVINGFTTLHITVVFCITIIVAAILWKVGAAAPAPFIYFQF
jgi:D-alanyl-lipoteichoic acid acyltransferase DltB (MBOAT superfamily)